MVGLIHPPPVKFIRFQVPVFPLQRHFWRVRRYRGDFDRIAVGAVNKLNALNSNGQWR